MAVRFNRDLLDSHMTYQGLVGRTPPATFSCWFRAESTAASGIMHLIRNPGSAGQQLLLYPFNGRLYAQWRMSGTPWNVTTSNSYTLGQWHHAILRADVSPSVIEVVLDGDFLNSDSDFPTGSPPSGMTHMQISKSTGTGDGLDGDIAFCGYWDEALTNAECQALAAGIEPLAIRPDALQFYLPLYNADAGYENVQHPGDVWTGGAVSGPATFPGYPPVYHRVPPMPGRTVSAPPVELPAPIVTQGYEVLPAAVVPALGAQIVSLGYEVLPATLEATGPISLRQVVKGTLDVSGTAGDFSASLTGAGGQALGSLQDGFLLYSYRALGSTADRATVRGRVVGPDLIRFTTPNDQLLAAVNWNVIEFQNLDGVSRADRTVTPVAQDEWQPGFINDVSKAFVTVNYQANPPTTGMRDQWVRSYLEDQAGTPTVVSETDSADSFPVSLQVVQLPFINVQHRQGTMLSFAGNLTVTISAVDLEKTFVLLSYKVADGSGNSLAARAVTAYMTSPTSVRMERLASGVDIDYALQIVTFDNSVPYNVSHNFGTLDAGQNQASVTIDPRQTPATTTPIMPTYGYQGAILPAAEQYGRVIATADITSEDTVLLDREIDDQGPAAFDVYAIAWAAPLSSAIDAKEVTLGYQVLPATVTPALGAPIVTQGYEVLPATPAQTLQPDIVTQGYEVLPATFGAAVYPATVELGYETLPATFGFAGLFPQVVELGYDILPASESPTLSVDIITQGYEVLPARFGSALFPAPVPLSYQVLQAAFVAVLDADLVTIGYQVLDTQSQLVAQIVTQGYQVLNASTLIPNPIEGIEYEWPAALMQYEWPAAPMQYEWPGE